MLFHSNVLNFYIFCTTGRKFTNIRPKGATDGRTRRKNRIGSHGPICNKSVILLIIKGCYSGCFSPVRIIFSYSRMFVIRMTVIFLVKFASKKIILMKSGNHFFLNSDTDMECLRCLKQLLTPSDMSPVAN